MLQLFTPSFHSLLFRRHETVPGRVAALCFRGPQLCCIFYLGLPPRIDALHFSSLGFVIFSFTSPSLLLLSRL